MSLDIESTLHYNNKKPVIYVPQKSVKKFNSYVYTHMHKSMLYKLIVRSKNSFKIGNPWEGQSITKSLNSIKVEEKV